MTTRIKSVLYWSAFVITLLAIYRIFDHRWTVYFLIPEPVKDEMQFVSSFNFYLENGWVASVAQGSSPIYNLLTKVLFNFIGSTLWSMRWLNVLSLLGMIILWSYFLWKDLGVSNRMLILSILFLVEIGLLRNTYFTAGNDSPFILFISMGFIFLYRGVVSENRNWQRFALSGLFFSLALGVRELLFLYMPGILFVFVLARLHHRLELRHLGIWLGVFMSVTILIHFPSIAQRGKISTHNKDLAVPHTWTERNYLQIKLNKPELPSWQEVTEFKKVYGENALPKSDFKAIFWDFPLTVKNSFRQLYYSVLPFIRHLGLIYVTLFIFLMVSFYQGQTYNKYTIGLVAMFYAFFTITFCALMIHRVEFRWFMFFSFLLCVFGIKCFSDFFKKSVLVEPLYYLNLIILGLINFLLMGVW